MRNTYPSDITREEFEMIREELEKVSKSLFSIFTKEQKVIS